MLTTVDASYFIIRFAYIVETKSQLSITSAKLKKVSYPLSPFAKGAEWSNFQNLSKFSTLQFRILQYWPDGFGLWILTGL